MSFNDLRWVARDEVFTTRPHAAEGLKLKGLWVAGSLAGLAHRTIAVVGTRAPSDAGRRRAHEFGSLCSSMFGDVDLLGLFHARKLRIHELALAAGWDTVHARLGITKPFYDRFTPAITSSDFALRPAGLDGALDFLAVCK